MRICICDDEQQELVRTTNLMKDFLNKQNINYELDTFDNAKVLINKLDLFYEDTNYDIYLLDIIMQVEGIEVAKKIREKDEDAIIVFITTSKDYAIEAFGVRATDYLLKPIEENEFNTKMSNVLKLLQNKVKTTFAFKSQDHTVISVSIENVVYIESINRRMLIHLDTFEEIYSPVLRTRFHESVPFDFKKHNFVHCHSSYIVNLNQIKNIEKNGFITKTDEFVPISKHYYQDVKKRYIDYLTGE